MDHNQETLIINILYTKSIHLLNHSLQTADIATILVEHLLAEGIDVGCSERFAYQAGLLHDIGKLYISEAILEKPAGFTERELETMKLHTSWGAMFVENIGLSEFKNVVSQHHVNSSGSGYPQGVGIEDLDQITRVVKIADIVSALAGDRPYRRGIVDDSYILEKLLPDVNQLFSCNTDIIKTGIQHFLKT